MCLVPPKPRNHKVINLKEFIEKMRFTVSDLARVCGCCRQTIQHCRDGVHKPSKLLLEKLLSVGNGWLTKESIQRKQNER